MAAIINLEVESGRLQSAIENMKSHLNGIRRIGSSMMSNVNALNSMWEGEAKTAFMAQFEADYETLNSMAEAIEKLIKNLEYAREQYDACEGSVASIIQGIRV